MRKYFIASVVAVMAFAFAAFAASLNVTAPTLQFGETAASELICTENADVVAWFYNDHLAGGPVNGASIQLDENHDCDGDRLYLTVVDQDDNILANSSVVIGESRNVTVGIPNAAALTDGSLSNISSADVYGVRIGIDQGY
jgi:hypothetical protein